jgi:hypothetical protein
MQAPACQNPKRTHRRCRPVTKRTTTLKAPVATFTERFEPHFQLFEGHGRVPFTAHLIGYWPIILFAFAVIVILWCVAATWRD